MPSIELTRAKFTSTMADGVDKASLRLHSRAEEIIGKAEYTESEYVVALEKAEREGLTTVSAVDADDKEDDESVVDVARIKATRADAIVNVANVPPGASEAETLAAYLEAEPIVDRAMKVGP